MEYTDALKSFDAELAKLHMRGQWLFDPASRDRKVSPADFGARMEPSPAGVPHLWKWDDVYPEAMKACEAMPESFTARRALAFKNPELPRCTAQTLNMAVQAIRPREFAWAHRHSMGAIRFVIKGNSQLHTVVDGIAYRMEDHDLVLTPNWTWHDHRNDSDEVVLWLDVLDVPLIGGLNQGFYEEFGTETQAIRNHSEFANPGLRAAWDGAQSDWHHSCRYPWRETEAMLNSFDTAAGCPYDGIALQYIDRTTLGPTLPTLSCMVQRLPKGFSGKRHRHTTSAVYFVVHGEGTTEADSIEMKWSEKDCFVVPNWTWHRHVNHSSKDDAVLFSVSDAPVLRTLGLYREEADRSAA
jgi:gentisate 1,2-dioxygenase